MAVNLLFFVLLTQTRHGKRKQHATRTVEYFGEDHGLVVSKLSQLMRKSPQRYLLLTLSRLKRNTAFATSTTAIVSNPELQITTQSIDDFIHQPQTIAP